MKNLGIFCIVIIIFSVGIMLGAELNSIGIEKKLAEEKNYIKGIHFAKNFGQHAALMAGLRKAKGDVVVCMDDDGQTPADEVGKLL